MFWKILFMKWIKDSLIILASMDTSLAKGDNQVQDVQRQKNALQQEIIIHESDLGKIKKEKIQLEAEFRHLKKDKERTEVIMREIQARLNKTEEEGRLAEEFVKGLKRKLNLL